METNGRAICRESLAPRGVLDGPQIVTLQTDDCNHLPGAPICSDSWDG